jgi:hypothetical protein
MAAFNWILVEGECPACHAHALIQSQTHVASDFGGDERGSFCVSEYRLGEPMAWWPPRHPKFKKWREGGDLAASNELPPEEVEEACYAGCTACEADLFVVVRFRNAVPVEVRQIGLEKDWPVGYAK